MLPVVQTFFTALKLLVLMPRYPPSKPPHMSIRLKLKQKNCLDGY